eukprot:3395047-Pyramimonas_sp.AAC.1
MSALGALSPVAERDTASPRLDLQLFLQPESSSALLGPRGLSAESSFALFGCTRWLPRPCISA